MKLNNKLMLLTAVFSAFSYMAQAQYLSAKDIYKYAKSRNYNALSQISRYIDTQDGKGNTALCLAVIDDDYQTYNLLRQYGANPQPYCLQSAMAVSGSSTFLGMGTTGWLVTGAIVAAGAGIAVAAGGGGGGGGSSGSSEPKKMPDLIGSTSDKNNDDINLHNTIYRDVYGMYNSSDPHLYNAYAYTSSATATINITNKSEGSIYGMYFARDNFSTMNNAYAYGNDAAGEITITNQGNGNIYGMYGNNGNYMYNSSRNTATGKITLINQGNGEVYGMYHSGTYHAYNANSATAEININNEGYGNVYGVYSTQSAVNSFVNIDDVIANGKINLYNKGEGDIYGLYGIQAHNAQSYLSYGQTYSSSSTAIGEIEINNQGSGNAYGLYSNIAEVSSFIFNARSEHDTAKGTIRINNQKNGNVYGLYGSNITNANSWGSNTISTGKVNITNSSDGNVYGLYGSQIYNANLTNGTIGGETPTNMKSTGIVNIVNVGKGNAYGMYAAQNSFINNYSAVVERGTAESLIEMVNNNQGLTVGVYSKDGRIYNSGEIKIHNLDNGIAVGIYADGAVIVENSGNITIDRADYTDDKATTDTSDDYTYTKKSPEGGTAIGIYGAVGSTISNSGTITITGSIMGQGYGIYSEGSYVTNTGTITIHGISCTGTDCTSANNAIVLNGGQLLQNGILTATNNTQNRPMSVSSVKPASLNLNDFGGTVVASGTSQFIVEGSISGDLAINNNVIENGFDTTYSVQDMIQAGDTSSLNLQSQSALFNATLENDTDAVMTMKAFNDVIENSSVADFLQNNYAANNNEDLFKVLKSAETVAQLNHDIDDLFGKDMLSRMAFEDLSMLREVSLDMNNHLFEKEGAFAFGENISPSSYDNNIGSVGRYSLNGYNNGKTSFGLGISITDVRTDDGHSDNRRFDRSFMMSAPIGYKTHGFELITAPKMGYTDGTYDRDGFNDKTYEGKIQKRMFALMNQARYPLKFGGMKLVPSAEFNMIGYNIKGHEDEQQYALRIKSQNHYSVEAGLGLMAEKEFKPFKNHKFNVNGGVAVYHEFANPYELDVAMNGMSGTYRLHDEKRSDNRTVARFGFNYKLKDDIDVTAHLLTNIDREYRTDAGIDLKYHF